MKLKVLCLNLWLGGRLMDEIIDFLRRQNADIVLLQEVYASEDSRTPKNYRSLETITSELPYEYMDFAPALVDNMPKGKVLSGNAVLSRFPITSREVIFFREPFSERPHPEDPQYMPSSPRNLQHVQLKTPGGRLELYNFQGVWDLDGDNYSDRRREMSQKIIGAVKGKRNVILAGDTNAQPTNKAMREVEKHLRSVFGTELQSTFNMKHKTNPGYATARVDMMFVSPNIKILEKRCHDVDVSDHLPLSATLEVGGR
jgi:endonuclease/exonuclease/phosphatase family metal-dependent hydrolase